MAKPTTQTSKKPATAAAPAPENKAKATEIAKREAAALPAHLAGIEEDADAGTSKDMSDNIVPLIYILQPLSPQVNRGTEQVPGAAAGDIWFRGTKNFIKGDVGMVVQWCFFDKCWIEWAPDRGGFVARHKERPSGAVQVLDPRDDAGKRKIWKTSADKGANDLVESREHVVIVREGLDRPQPYVIPMSGSQHTSARGWMMLANGQVIPGTNKTPAIWACLYRMKTKFIDDGKHQWFGWEIENASEDGSTAWVASAEDYANGKKLHGDFSSGALKADVDSDAGQGLAGSESSDAEDGDM
jgi:hypothetical protein